MYRYDIINRFAEQRFQRNCKYLEIGIRDPSVCFDLITANNKTSVDPGMEEMVNLANYRVTSDEFFYTLESSGTEFPVDHKWDIIFIDGLHLADTCYRDILNSLNHISPNGVIVLHDCNPPHEGTAYSDLNYFYQHAVNHNKAWNGTVWKSFYYYRTHANFLTYTVDTDWGVGIIDTKYSANPIPHKNKFFEFNNFIDHRKEHLNLISVEEFISKDLT